VTPGDPRGADADEIGELLDRYRSTGDRAARNEIVERHRSLADRVARRYASRGIAVEDLRQTALLAMVRALDRFDPQRGASFATFAGRTMEGELKRSLRDRAWAVRPPRAAQERYLELRRREEELAHRLGRLPTVAEIADAMEVTVDDVLEAVEAAGARTSAPLTRTDDDGDEVPADARLGHEDHGFAGVDDALIVAELLDVLDERSRTAVELRFYERLGQDEIAARLGISQSYLSRVLRRALVQMREQLEASAATDTDAVADPADRGGATPPR
jgi:RNA polymerase sigma-B factor